MSRFTWLLALLLIGCSSQPLYSPARNADSRGYYETRLTNERYRVIFTGGSNTSDDKVKNLALLRAAELTADHGYDWFQIIDRDNSDNTNTDNPRVSISVGVGTGTGSCYPYGCRVFGGPYYSGARLYSTNRYDRNQSVIEIYMGKGEPTDPTKVYNARELMENLRQQAQK